MASFDEAESELSEDEEDDDDSGSLRIDDSEDNGVEVCERKSLVEVGVIRDVFL